MSRARPASWVVPLALAPLLAQSLLDGFYKAALYRWSPVAFWWADVAKFVVIPGVVLYYLARAGGVRPRDYGLAAPATPSERDAMLGNALLATLLLVPTYLLAQEWIGRLWPAATVIQFAYETALPQQRFLRELAVAYYALSAGLVEEIVFRGLPWACFERFRGRHVRAVYVLVTAILFGLAHWENGAPDVLSATAFGLGAAALYLKLGTLWPIIVAHVLTDLIAFS